MILIIIGFLSGIISGMGIGGGTVLIPALILFNNTAQIEAQGINLIVFIPISIIAIITHMKQGNIETYYTKRIIPTGVVGAIFGSYIATKINPDLLGKAFAVFLLVIGVYELTSKKE